MNVIGDDETGSSPGLDSLSAQAFPKQLALLQWHIMRDSSYSGGTAPAYTGFPIKSYDTCFLSYLVFMLILTVSMTLVNKLNIVFSNFR